MADDLARGVEQYIKENFPTGVSVPTGVSEDEATRAVQEQFEQAGFGCPEDQAREIVREAWRTAE